VILKDAKMTPEDAARKRKKQAGQNQEYEGNWEHDRREGWGMSRFKNGDVYKGHFG
jgi:hypothetical protein